MVSTSLHPATLVPVILPDEHLARIQHAVRDETVSQREFDRLVMEYFHSLTQERVAAGAQRAARS